MQDPQHYQWHMPVSGMLSQDDCLLPTQSTKVRSSSFAEKVIKAAKGEKGIVEPTFVYLPGVSGGEPIAKETGVEFFSVPVELGVRKKNTRAPELVSLTLQSLLELKRQQTSSQSWMRMRRSFSRQRRRDSKATLRRVSNSF